MISDFARCVGTAIAVVLTFTFVAEASETDSAPEYTRADARYKADILLIVAHPDDDTAIAGYLARAICDEHRRLAVIYTTRGDAGGNAVGNSRGKALGTEREIEARRALGYFGVTNVWFLDAHDTPSQNVLSSLEYMDHGSILAQVVRLIRVTQPEVILAWLPLPVAGENHADHQASSVIASEAFDLAGDASAFGEQVASALGDPAVLGHDPEGLDLWQPKKIYYFSDAYDAGGYWWTEPLLPSPFRKNFLEGAGPAYSSTDISPAKQLSYARLSAEETSVYITQEGDIGKEALAQGAFKAFEAPTRFVYGKSVVGGSALGDIFEGVTPGSIPFVRPSGAAAQTHTGMSLELGGPWKFYREFWRAHALNRLANLLPVPEVNIGSGHSIDIPLVIRNNTATKQQVNLIPVLPQGWSENARYSTFPLPANSTYPVNRQLTAPAGGKPGWYEVTWKAEAGVQQIGSVAIHVYVSG